MALEICECGCNAVHWKGSRVKLAPLHKRILNRLTSSRVHVTAYELSDELGTNRPTIAGAMLKMRRAFRAVDPSFDRLETSRSFGYRWRA